jgi:hypothetical protein
MNVPTTSLRRHRYSLPDEPGRRAATLSLVMVGATAVAMLVAGALGTFLGLVVFGLEDQELLSDAGAWGYVAGVFLVALMALPGMIGIVFGFKARRLGARRPGNTGIVVNAAVTGYLVVTAAVTLVFG